MKQDMKALLISAHQKAFTVAGCLDDQTAKQCRVVLYQSLCTGASWHTTKMQLQTLFGQSQKAPQA